MATDPAVLGYRKWTDWTRGELTVRLGWKSTCKRRGKVDFGGLGFRGRHGWLLVRKILKVEDEGG